MTAKILICGGSSVLTSTVKELYPIRQNRIIIGKLLFNMDYGSYDALVLDRDNINCDVLRDLIVDKPELRDKIILIVDTITIDELQMLKRLNITHIIKKPFKLKTIQEKLYKVIGK